MLTRGKSVDAVFASGSMKAAPREVAGEPAEAVGNIGGATAFR